MNEELTKLKQLLKKKTDEFDKSADENIKLEKTNKQLVSEREKMKARIQKLISRKGKFDSGIKTCKKCNKEYNEKENFNWSCRTHQSDWGGEMWWCCGKPGKDQPGCKFSKHESKDDDEDDIQDDQDEGNKKQMKYVRCNCCKEVGHSIDQCPRDPNLRTAVNYTLDFDRIARIKDFRKLYADTVVQTTHFIKKSVMVPLEYDDEGIIQENENINHPFMRGIMNFDDYNYQVFNPYILLEEPNAERKRQEALERKQ